MNKFASELILKPVLVRDAITRGEGAMIGLVENLIICPDDGSLAGITIREGFGKKSLKTLSTKDILGISSEFYLIPSYNLLGDLDEIVRLKEILDRGIPITGNKVYTQSGTFLGKVFDYTLDLTSFKISRLYVRPTLLGGLAKQYIIDYKNIISIEKNRIVVVDATSKGAETVLSKNVVSQGASEFAEC
jgi:sporulation protein YlmC with PRC-barrel domain